MSITGPTGLALSAAPWETGLVSALAAQSRAIGDIRRCVDVVALLAEAGSAAMPSAVIDADFPKLDATVVGKLTAAGMSVAGICSDNEGARRLAAWGVRDVVIADTAHPDRTAADVIEVLRRLAIRARAAAEGVNTGFGDLSADAAGPIAELPGRDGKILAVWGPPGAPGRTTVALGIGEHLAALGIAAMVIDADTQAPGVADALGMPADASGLIAACRHGEGGTLDAVALARSARALSPQLRVLTGVPAPSRAAELRPAALGALWAAARTLTPFTIVDVGAAISTEPDFADSFGIASPGSAAASALASADAVVAVSGCEPLALARLLSRFDDVAEAGGGAPVHVVLNRSRSGLGGSKAARQAAELVLDRTAAATVSIVADDRDSFDAAMLRSQTITEFAPASPVSRALAELALTLRQAVLSEQFDTVAG